MQPKENTNIHAAFILSMNCLCVQMIYHTVIVTYLLFFCTVNLYILCIYDLFHILPYLWQSYGSMECTYARARACVRVRARVRACACVCVCKYVWYDGLQEYFYITSMVTPDPQPTNLSVSLTENEHTPKRQTEAYDGTEPAAERDILMEYSTD